MSNDERAGGPLAVDVDLTITPFEEALIAQCFADSRMTELKLVAFPGEAAVDRIGPVFYWAWTTAERGGRIRLHPHRGFEIISYCLKGEVAWRFLEPFAWHDDGSPRLSGGPMGEGDAWVLQAGSGVFHEEEGLTEGAEFLQIWFEPDLREATGRAPTYRLVGRNEFPRTSGEGVTIKTVLGAGAPAPFVADVRMTDVAVAPGASWPLRLACGRSVAAVVVEGGATLAAPAGATSALRPRDFFVAHARRDVDLVVAAPGGVRLVVNEFPTELGYPLEPVEAMPTLVAGYAPGRRGGFASAAGRGASGQPGAFDDRGEELSLGAPMPTPPSLLNLSAWRSARMNDEPYAWALLEPTFTSPQVAAELGRCFPAAGYERFRRVEGAKRHDLSGLRLIDRHRVEPAHLTAMPPPWRRLAAEVLGGEYRDALSALTGVSLEGLRIEGTLWRHPEGSFIDPHPDNPGKVVTHLFYFNDEPWGPEHGGCLRILRSPDLEDCAQEIPPRLDTSLVFVRSDRSWHGYKPVGPGRVRLAFQVIFCRDDMQYSGENVEYARE